MTDILNYQTDGNIAIISIDSPPVNALGYSVREGLVEGFNRAYADDTVEAVILTCEGRTFFAGADIKEFGKPSKSPDLRDVLKVIEGGTKLTVAAMHGTALGGGLETALCCHYRLAEPSTKVGLPEVKLGLLPGAGGTQRLPRIVGVSAALDMITSGRFIGAEEALQTGVINAITTEDNLLKDAITFARDKLSEKVSLSHVRDRDEKIKEFRGDPKIFEAFRTKNARKFRGFKAPENIIRAIEAAVKLPFEEGVKKERDLFEELMEDNQSTAQRYVFFAERQTSKVPDIPKDTPARKIKKIAVIGAGTMGGGIAMNFLSAGIPVTLLERSQDPLNHGISVIRKNYERSAKRGRMTLEEVQTCMDLITPSTDYQDLTDSDLIIEAVFEQMDIKKEVFEKLDTVAKADAILASNTSYLDLNEIADATSRPENVVGLHFFSPANIMPLLEVVRGAITSKEIINTSMKLGRKIGKVPVLSRVCWGFIANRVMKQRGIVADEMILQGISPEAVDKVIFDYGFAVGPFAMKDIVGLDVIGRDASERTVDGDLVSKDRLGLKKNGGYYDYDANRKKTISPVALSVISDVAKVKGIKSVQANSDEILARLLYPIVNEGAKLLDEGIALRASDIDIACIKGYNWPIYTGGPMFWADTIGLNKIVEKLQEFETQFGSRFAPSPFLIKRANSGGKLTDH